MTPARTARLGLLFAAFASWMSTQETSAEPNHKARRSVPVHASRTAPDVTATIAKPAAAAPPQAAVTKDDDVVPPPFTLPAASRAKVRSCGETWRDRKLAGTTGDDDWRDFALKCLVDQGSAALAN